jgi:hypothetical protein
VPCGGSRQDGARRFDLPVPPLEAGAVRERCRVYWGSHGCALERGHHGPHVCVCAPLLARLLRQLLPWHRQAGEVGAPPYYGADTRFYGEDVAP